MASDFAPHNLTNPTSGLPCVVSESTAYSGGNLGFAAFNNSFDWTNSWLATGGGIDYLQIYIGGGDKQILQSYSIKVNTDNQATRAPKNWTMLGSNDGATWDTLDTVANETAWGNGELRSYTCDVATTAYRYFRLSITANNGDATYTQVAELYLYGDVETETTQFAPHDLTSNTSHSPFVTSASSNYGGRDAFSAFDGVPSSLGNEWLGTGGGTDSLKLDIGPGNSKILASYILQMGTDGIANRAPKNWTMEGSNDNSTWDTLDTVTNQTAWGAGEARGFTCDVQTTAYRYFRLSITANNGDATYTQVSEFYLYELAEVPAVELAAESAGTSATAAALQVTRNLAAASAGTSTAAGTLRTGIKMAASSAGVSTVAASLAVTRGLAAISVGTSTVAGGLYVARGLAGRAAGICLVMGTLLIPIRRRIFSDGGAALPARLFGAAPEAGAPLYWNPQENEEP